MVGLDLSLECPGIAVYRKDANFIVYVDSFPNKPEEKNKYLRYVEIKLWIDQVLFAYEPETVIVEEAFMSALTAHSNVPILNLHGYIVHHLLSKGVKVLKIMPSSARSFLKIKPNNKEEAYNWVKEKFPFVKLTDFKKDNDKSDAIVLVLNHNNEDCLEYGEKRKKVKKVKKKGVKNEK